MLTINQYLEREGITISDIAHIIGRSERTVKRRLSNAGTWKQSEMDALVSYFDNLDIMSFFYPLMIRRIK